MMGIGVQHVFSSEARDMYRQTLPFVTAISTRGEHDSQFITQELGYPASRVVTARDLVFLLEPDAHDAPAAPEPTSQRPKLALSRWLIGSWAVIIKRSIATWRVTTPATAATYPSTCRA